MRLHFAFLLIVMLLPAAARSATGDVNGDKAITVADAAMALRYAGGLAAPTFQQTAAADVQADGRVTVADAVRIARIAARVDPLPPTLPLVAGATLTVANKDVLRNFALPGGYAVSGTVRDRRSQVFDGAIALQDASGVTWGPVDLDAQGGYSIALPPGRYQAFVLTRRIDTTPSGEDTVSEASVLTGAPFDVSGTAAGVNFTRPDIAAPATVTFDFTGPSRPYQTETDITLTDTGVSPATGGLNTLHADVLFVPTQRAVPPGTYQVDTHSYYTLSSGLTEDLYLSFNQTLTVPATKSRTLAFPTVYELGGDFTGPNGPDALDFYAEQIPKAGADKTTVYVPERFGGYLVEIPAGNYVGSVYVATPYADTKAEFALPITMPAKNVAKDISLPTFPAFRTVSGTVFAPDGSPLPNARVRVDSVPVNVPASGVYLFHGDTTTDTNGAYAVALPAGDYNVAVTPQ